MGLAMILGGRTFWHVLMSEFSQDQEGLRGIDRGISRFGLEIHCPQKRSKGQIVYQQFFLCLRLPSCLETQATRSYGTLVLRVAN